MERQQRSCKNRNMCGHEEKTIKSSARFGFFFLSLDANSHIHLITHSSFLSNRTSGSTFIGQVKSRYQKSNFLQNCQLQIASCNFQYNKSTKIVGGNGYNMLHVNISPIHNSQFTTHILRTVIKKLKKRKQDSAQLRNASDTLIV